VRLEDRERALEAGRLVALQPRELGTRVEDGNAVAGDAPPRARRAPRSPPPSPRSARQSQRMAGRTGRPAASTASSVGPGRSPPPRRSARAAPCRRASEGCDTSRATTRPRPPRPSRAAASRRCDLGGAEAAPVRIVGGSLGG
jgi:hypothetical protein